MEILFVIFIASSALAIIYFLFYLVSKERCLGYAVLRTVEVFNIIVVQWIFVSDMDCANDIDCFPQPPFFAPTHRLTIYSLLIISSTAYFYSTWRTKLAKPLLELIINCLLLLGISINVFIAIHLDDNVFWLLIQFPIISLFLMVVIKNQQLFFDETLSQTAELKNLLDKACREVLKLTGFKKYSVLLFLCLPLLLLHSTLLLVCGQQPDSFIKAFSETYGYGLSHVMVLTLPG